MREVRTRISTAVFAAMLAALGSAILVLGGVRDAGAKTFFTENFDELTSAFQPAVDESWSPASEPVWTHTPPAGWSIDNSNMPSVQGVTEWQGWSFTRLNFWVTVSGDQERSAFTKCSGVIAVADPDEWDDKNNPSASGTYDSVLISPPIPVDAATTTYLHFDSHYRQEADQTAEVAVSINGGPDQVLLHYDGDPNSDNHGEDVQNAHVVLEIPPLSTTGTIVIKWHLFNARNNWFWAIDNVELNEEPPPPPPPEPGDFIALGPYSRFTAPDSVEIFWETKTSGVCTLEYGETDPPDTRIAESEAKKVHSIEIKGLKPETLYYYRIVLVEGTSQTVSELYSFDNTYNYSPPPFPDAPSPYPRDALSPLYEQAADLIVSSSTVTKGYCLIVGCGEGRLAYELAKRTDLQIVGIEDDAAKVAKAREALEKARLYGSRVTVQQLPLDHLPYPSNFANLIVSDDLVVEGRLPGSAAEIARVLRPFGGVVFLGQPSGAPHPVSRSELESWLGSDLSSSTVTENNDGLWAFFRRGALEGVGTWTHMYADAANTACSGDELLKGRLRVQWFGRPGAGPMIDRDCRIPAPLYVNGRLFYQGFDRLFAQDAYNGTVLWTLDIPNLRRVNMPRDCSNMAADENSLFLAVKEKCWVLDGATGEWIATFGLPDETSGGGKPYDWGYVARVGDLLYGSAVKRGSFYTAIEHGEWYDGWGWEGYKVTSVYLFALDKNTGAKVWSYHGGAIINPTIAIGDGCVYFIECRNPTVLAQATGRIGIPELWQDQYLVALDAATGTKLWEKSVSFGNCNVVFYLSYAKGIILVTGSKSEDKKYHLYTFRAADGSPIWDRHYSWLNDNHGKHMQHPVIVGDMIVEEPCQIELQTGNILKSDMPMRNKCGTISASAHALFYRDYNNGMWDLTTGSRSEWVGIRANCWLSLVPAGGLLLAPEGSSGCTCDFPIQTSLAYTPE